MKALRQKTRQCMRRTIRDLIWVLEEVRKLDQGSGS